MQGLQRACNLGKRWQELRICAWKQLGAVRKHSVRLSRRAQLFSLLRLSFSLILSFPLFSVSALFFLFAFCLTCLTFSNLLLFFLICVYFPLLGFFCFLICQDLLFISPCVCVSPAEVEIQKKISWGSKKDPGFATRCFGAEERQLKIMHRG